MYTKYKLEIIQFERNAFVTASENLNGGTEIGEQTVLDDDE